MNPANRPARVTSLLIGAAFVLAACSGTGASGSTSPSKAPGPPLKIAQTVWVGYGPLYLAKAKGFFAQEGVDVELVQQQDFRQQFVALAADKVDGIANVVDATISYRVPGVNYKIVVAMDDSLGGDGIAASNSIKTIADLKGKKVAYETGATAQFFLNVQLHKAGMTEKDITHVDMLGSDAGAALLAGQVDAAVTYEPYLSQLRTSATTHVLLDTSTAPGLIIDVLLFSQKVIDQRPDDIKAVVRAYYKALDYLKQNPDDAVKIMAAGVGGFLVNPKDFADTLKYVVFYDKARNASYFNAANDPSVFTTLKNAIEIWGSINPSLGAIPDPKNLVDASFIGG